MKYIIYARKSREDEDKQVLSIEAQQVELQEFAAKEKLEIVASLCEAKTAKEPGRTKFAEMLEMIESGKAQGIISWHPDRLARNSVDGGKIIYFIDRGLIRALKFPTFWFEPTPQGLFMLQIAFGQSKYYVDNLRENVMRGLRQKLRNGVWPGLAPIGYLNNPKTRGIDVDEGKAPKIAKLFELYATGEYTLKQLAIWSKENGLSGRKDRPMTINGVHTILKSSFYVGLMRYGGEMYHGTHAPLISKKLFDRAQAVLQKRGKNHIERTHHFPFLRFLYCAECSCAITAERQKGHHYYRCTKKKGTCSQKYMREETLTEQIVSFLQKVSLSSQDTEKILRELDKDEACALEETQTQITELKAELKDIEKTLDDLLDLRLTHELSTEEYLRKKEVLLSRKVEVEEKVKEIEEQGVSWLEPAREFVLSLNQAAQLLEKQEKTEMKTFLKNIGSNHMLENRQFHFVPKAPYDLLAEAAIAAEANLTFLNLSERRDSNPKRTVPNRE